MNIRPSQRLRISSRTRRDERNIGYPRTGRIKSISTKRSTFGRRDHYFRGFCASYGNFRSANHAANHSFEEIRAGRRHNWVLSIAEHRHRNGARVRVRRGHDDMVGRQPCSLGNLRACVGNLGLGYPNYVHVNEENFRSSIA